MMRFDFINGFYVLAVAIPLGLLLQCLPAGAVDLNWDEPGEDCYLVGEYSRRLVLKFEEAGIGPIGGEPDETSTVNPTAPTTPKPATEIENLFSYLKYSTDTIKRLTTYYEDAHFNASMVIKVEDFENEIMSLYIETVESETHYIPIMTEVNVTEPKHMNVTCPNLTSPKIKNYVSSVYSDCKPEEDAPITLPDRNGVCFQNVKVNKLYNKTHTCERPVNVTSETINSTEPGECKYVGGPDTVGECDVPVPVTFPPTTQTILPKTEDTPAACPPINETVFWPNVNNFGPCETMVSRTGPLTIPRIELKNFTDCVSKEDTNLPVIMNGTKCVPHVYRHNETHKSIKSGVDFEGKVLYVDRKDVSISPTIEEDCKLTLVKKVSQDRELTQVFRCYSCGCTETLSAFDVANNKTYTVDLYWMRTDDWKWDLRAQAQCEDEINKELGA